MTVLTEGKHPGDFILSEANGYRSREAVTLLTGSVYKSGTVLRFVANDADTVDTVDDVHGPGKFAPWEAGYDAVAISYGNYDGSSGDVAGVAVVRDAEVIAAELVWPENTTDQQKAEETVSLRRISNIHIR